MRALLLPALLALVACGCTYQSPPLVDPNQPQSIRVTLATGFDRGTPETRRPFVPDAETIPVDIQVLGPDGRPLAWTGWLEARIEPGELVGVTGGVGPYFEITGGAASGVEIRVRRVFSDARIWLEDVGFVPADPTTAACANGIDDDGDGAADHPFDGGCRFVNDGTEEPGSHAIGVTDIIYFANPRLSDVQGFASASPLSGRRVVVSDGEMIVTRITTDGFYVSEIDRSDPMAIRAVPWSNMFVFSFNTPPFLRACDRITSVSGSVGEFFGFTELNQPSWDSEWWCPATGGCPDRGGRPVGPPQPCPIPEPAVLDMTVIGTPDMEQHESALVRIADVTFPARFGPERFDPGCMPDVAAGRFCGSNCDFDGDGDVTLTTGTAEDDCNDDCSADPQCSEWNQFVEFGQIAVQSGGGVINLVTRESVSEFDPFDFRGQTFASITGTLRNFAPIGPQRGFILEPRCDADIVMTGPPVPSSMACVFPRTGGPDDPM